MAKRSITIAGHRTSMSLETEFWDGLAAIAAAEKTSLAALVASIDRTRKPAVNLSAAIRIFVLGHYRKSGRGAL
jgi:predicted DNA-binding ribbon-helix-helix protein